ncbi:MAG: PAS domain-containing sensor histidine kinase [Salinivirgaceae bacterium]|nr:PAS domain-containing sensor histidine kinase [Salinivirgaceae bacterium]
MKLLFPLKIKSFVLLLFIMGGNALFSSEHPRNILLINSYHQGLSWTDDITKAIQDSIGTLDCTLFIEYLDAKRNNIDSYDVQFATTLEQKYKLSKIDIVIVSDNIALTFAIQFRDQISTNAPIVFCGINNFDQQIIENNDNITGVIEKTSPLKTVEQALKTHPNTKRIFIISDSTETGLEEIKHAKAELNKTITLPISYLVGLSMENLIQEIKQLKNDDLVLLILFNRDNKGVYYSYEESGKLIVNNAPCPVYGLWDFYIGTGVVGGRLVNATEQGSLAFKITKQLIEGDNISNFPINKISQNHWMYDYVSLKKWGIVENTLPTNSLIKNKPYGWLEQNIKLVILILVIMIAEALIILLLTWILLRNRRIATENLKISESRYKSIFNNNHVIIMLIEPETLKIVDVNSAACNFYGWNYETLINKRITEINTAPESEIRNYLKISLAKKQNHFIYEHKLASGITRNVEIYSGPISVNNQQLHYSIIHDITARIEAENAISLSNQQLSETIKQKDKLISIIAHDIRNPFTTLLGMSDLLNRKMEEQSIEKSKRMVGILKESMLDILNIFENLIEWAQIQSKGVTLNIKPLNVKQITQKSILTYQKFAEVKRIRIDLSIPDDIYVNADERAFEMIIRNLVSNAIKYTNQDGFISISAQKHNHKTLKISISDNGIGIPPEIVQTLFNFSENRPRVGTTGEKGSGIGLALCYDFIVMMNGIIQTQSIVDEGTTFHVFLPLYSD